MEAKSASLIIRKAKSKGLQLGSGQVYRRDLVGRIIGDVKVPIVVIHGPAGHGKSTLLRQLISELHQADERVAMFKVRQEHNDISRFLADFQSALQLRPAGTSDQGGQRSAISKHKGLSFTDFLVTELTRDDNTLTVIFDDFHCISSRSILSLVGDLLDRAMQGIRFVLSSREVPDIGIERLIINGRAMMLGAEDLRFSRCEVQNFMDQWGDDPLDHSEADALFQWTQGWPAGLQLLKLAYKDKATFSKTRVNKDMALPLLTHYLADNVLAVQPPDVQDFLLKTSVLKSLSTPLCEAVTGYRNCQSILEGIARSGVFISATDERHQHYSYHSLFSTFLMHQLHSQLPAVEREVHQTALAWYRQQGLHEEGLFHADALQDVDTMADILDAWSTELIIAAHLETVEYWYDRLPNAQISERPALTVKVAWALIFLRRFEKLTSILNILDHQCDEGLWPDLTSVTIIRSVVGLMNDDVAECERLIKSITVEQLRPEEFRAFELSAVANMQALMCLYRSQFDDARELLAISHAYSTNVSAIFSDSYSCGVNGFRLMAQGFANEAFFELEEKASNKRFYLAGAFAASALISCHAWALYERNELEQAKMELESSIEGIIDSCLLDWMAMAFVTLSRVYWLAGQSKQQDALLSRAESIGFSRGWKRMTKVAYSERVRCGLASGHLNLAKTYNSRLKSIDDERWPSNYVGFYDDTDSTDIIDLRLALRGKNKAAYPSLQMQIQSARDNARSRRLLTLLVIKSLFEKQRDDLTSAYNDLTEALSLAAPEGYIRCFLDEGNEVHSLLLGFYNQVSAQRHNKLIDLTFLERVISGFGFIDEVIKAQKPKSTIFHEPLTNRETQILDLVSVGMQNKEIATTVFLSENTVKFHLKNIFSKLGVSNRTQAISVAGDKE